MIKEFKYSPFELNFKSPFVNAKNSFTKRNGLIIKITDDFGNVGFGECSPLPGFSSESINEVSVQLEEVQKNFDKIDSSQIKNFPVENLYPSVRFALEQAIISLNLTQKKIIHELSNIYFKSQIPVNAIVGITETSKLESIINSKIDQGFTTIKIKLDNVVFVESVRLLKSIFSNHTQIKIRIDLNGSWDYETAIENIKLFDGLNIEYLEQPCSNPHDIIKLFQKTEIPIAVDESINVKYSSKNLFEAQNIKFFVVKPMIFGGINKTLEFIHLAEQLEKNVIISSALESPIGFNALALLAASVNHNFAHGLDTLNLFDLPKASFMLNVDNGKINFDINAHSSINKVDFL